MIFLTVGSEYPFDRLVKAVDALLEQSYFHEEFFAQIGNTLYTPKFMAWTANLNRTDFSDRLRSADAVISHAGMGTIISCLEMGKPLLVMPRKVRYRELVSDHQVGTAEKFMNRGDILVAHDTDELPDRIIQLRTFKPHIIHDNLQKVINYIEQYITSVETKKRVFNPAEVSIK